MPHYPIVRNRNLIGLDAIGLAMAATLAYFLCVGWLGPGANDYHIVMVFAIVAIPIKLLVFAATGLYRRIWSYASVAELERIVGGLVIATLCAAVVGELVVPFLNLTSNRVPLPILAIDSLLTGAFIITPRLFFRIRTWHGQQRRRTDDVRAIIVGAGAAGQMIAKELLTNPKMGLYPVAFVDDDDRKANHRLNDIPVLGTIADIGKVAHERDAGALVIAIPSAPGSLTRRVVQAASDAGLKTRTLPPLSDVLSGRASPSLAQRPASVSPAAEARRKTESPT